MNSMFLVLKKLLQLNLSSLESYLSIFFPVQFLTLPDCFCGFVRTHRYGKFLSHLNIQGIHDPLNELSHHSCENRGSILKKFCDETTVYLRSINFQLKTMRTN